MMMMSLTLVKHQLFVYLHEGGVVVVLNVLVAVVEVAIPERLFVPRPR